MNIKTLLVLANITLVAVMIGLYFLVDYMGPGFAFGMIFMGFLFQSAYRLRHGHWFDIEPHKDDACHR